jgi:hypothetical protein
MQIVPELNENTAKQQHADGAKNRLGVSKKK